MYSLNIKIDKINAEKKRFRAAIEIITVTIVVGLMERNRSNCSSVLVSVLL